MKPITIGQTITDRQDASLSIYFKDVSKQPMIDINEEIALAKRVQKGDKQALDKLVKANLRFAISVAKQYQNKGLSLVDLIQEASFGLIEAAKKYDPDRGYKFISYAVWWIRQAIMRAISEQCRTVRVPMNQIANLNKINKVADKFEKEYQRKPSNEELEEETKIESNKISLAITSIGQSLSLDAPFSTDQEAGCLLDVIPNNNSINTDSQAIDESISKELESVLYKLSNREGDVIRMSFGLGMFPMTLEEIAIRFGIGAERVRQIQHEALCKIKEKYSKELKELL
jgi:RNA polymerase primary sigma factor